MVLIESTYPRAHFTSPRRGEADLRSKSRGSAQALPLHLTRRSLHRTFVVKAVLVVFDDGGDGFQRELAVGILHHVLQIEILDRDVVVAVFERAAQRLEIRLLHLR